MPRLHLYYLVLLACCQQTDFQLAVRLFSQGVSRLIALCASWYEIECCAVVSAPRFTNFNNLAGEPVFLRPIALTNSSCLMFPITILLVQLQAHVSSFAFVFSVHLFSITSQPVHVIGVRFSHLPSFNSHLENVVWVCR